MKRLLLALALVCITAPAIADDNVQIIRREGDVVRNLPGNAQIVTNTNRGPNGVLIYNDDSSLIYRTLVRPNTRNYGPVTPNTAYQSDVNRACPGALSVTDRNKCIRDVLRVREKYQRKVND